MIWDAIRLYILCLYSSQIGYLTLYRFNYMKPNICMNYTQVTIDNHWFRRLVNKFYNNKISTIYRTQFLRITDTILEIMVTVAFIE